MGTDISFHTEAKIDGTWHHYSHPDFIRNYDIFTKMKENIKPMPTDMSIITQIHHDRWPEEIRTESWMSASELDIFVRWCMNNIEVRGTHNQTLDELFYGRFLDSSWLNFGTFFPKEIEDIRFIYWFTF